MVAESGISFESDINITKFLIVIHEYFLVEGAADGLWLKDFRMKAVKHILVHPIECLQGALIRGGSAVLILGRVKGFDSSGKKSERFFVFRSREFLDAKMRSQHDDFGEYIQTLDLLHVTAKPVSFFVRQGKDGDADHVAIVVKDKSLFRKSFSIRSLQVDDSSKVESDFEYDFRFQREPSDVVVLTNGLAIINDFFGLIVLQNSSNEGSRSFKLPAFIEDSLPLNVFRANKNVVLVCHQGMS
ncbi:hypothetical protein SCHPADRAFT_335431 [Schizopora paradoxa]|uniref:Uncharacterized protein n=1 Tax=Schizopora paradoxa TaxID=27342 RepID=A0A0H2RPY9_9AGAM|nr:hypothetical protein SCHPADRAFT_335431 [Schizopora paradoxa]